MSTIKTKIGFETKPHAIEALYLDDLFSMSTKTFGRILLLIGTLIALSNWVYLKQIKSTKIRKLQCLEQEGLQLEKQYNRLTIDHEMLSSNNRLKSISLKVNMHQPSNRMKINFPKSINFSQ